VVTATGITKRGTLDLVIIIGGTLHIDGLHLDMIDGDIIIGWVMFTMETIIGIEVEMYIEVVEQLIVLEDGNQQLQLEELIERLQLEPELM